MYKLIDGRDANFEIIGEKEILNYLCYPECMTIDEAMEEVERENDGMDFYHIIEVCERLELKVYNSSLEVFKNNITLNISTDCDHVNNEFYYNLEEVVDDFIEKIEKECGFLDEKEKEEIETTCGMIFSGRF